MADSPRIFQVIQSFQLFDARFAFGCSMQGIPVVERDESERCNVQNNEDEGTKRNAMAAQKN
jgi:hypothetical protein